MHSLGAQFLWAPRARSRRGQVQTINEGVDKENGIVLADIFVEQFRQQQRLGAVVTDDVRHGPDSNAYCAEPESVSVEFSHGLQDFRISRKPWP